MLFSNAVFFFRKKLETLPLHLLLLPVFFIVHSYIQYAGLLDIKEAMMAFLKVTICILLFFIVFKLILKNISRAAVFSTVCSVFFLFFGDIKKVFSELPVLNFLSHYKTLVPLLFILLLFVFIRIKRGKQMTRSTLFLNILFLLYFTIDIAKLFFPIKTKTGMIETILLPVENRSPGNFPDIYYILTDCYPSRSFQKDKLGLDNNHLDSHLLNQGFHIINEPRSNYSNTAFSMASIFGMNYFSNIDTVFQIAPFHPYYYNLSMNIVKTAPLFKFLKNRGYQFLNLSNFDLLQYPAFSKDLFLSISTTQMIFYNTFWNCIRRDLTWQLMPGLVTKMKNEKKKSLKRFFTPMLKYNKDLLDTLSKLPDDGNSHYPYFVYAHLKMPHFPYFFDSTGKQYTDESLYTDSLIIDRSKFANYIVYTNHKIAESVNGLLRRTGGNDIIIIQSDHAINDLKGSNKQDAFRNYSAFYFPDKDYSMLYDSMSNVNTFRVILNKYFEQKLPLLKDKTYFIR